MSELQKCWLLCGYVSELEVLTGTVIKDLQIKLFYLSTLQVLNILNQLYIIIQKVILKYYWNWGNIHFALLEIYNTQTPHKQSGFMTSPNDFFIPFSIYERIYNKLIPSKVWECTLKTHWYQYDQVTIPKYRTIHFVHIPKSMQLIPRHCGFKFLKNF